METTGNIRAFDKIDGTLIKIYFYKGWNISTRSYPYADQPVDGFPDVSFRELVLSVLSMENIDKIVTDYGANPQLWYLMSRNNLTGEYIDHREQLDSSLCSMPNEYIFNNGNVPILKNNKICMSNIIELFASGEKSEYLSYFPEHESLFSEIEFLYDTFLTNCKLSWDIIQRLGLSRKDVGLSHLDPLVKSMVFKLIDNPNCTVEKIIDQLSLNRRISLINKIYDYGTKS